MYALVTGVHTCTLPIYESVARSAVIEEGLREAGLTDVALLTERKGLVAHLTALEPDVVLISLENPSRDTLEESFLVSRSLGKPIAMFVDRSEEHTSELQSLMRISYAVFCLIQKNYNTIDLCVDNRQEQT